MTKNKRNKLKKKVLEYMCPRKIYVKPFIEHFLRKMKKKDNLFLVLTLVVEFHH